MNSQKEQIQTIKKTAIEVITNPAGFFRNMPVTGGFVEPLIFLAAMGVLSGLIQAVFSIVGLGMHMSFFMALASIIIVPVLVAIFGFIGAGIFFIVWKLMGSGQSYETAYRCVAYAAAITPITTLIGMIPYLGAAIGLRWMMYLMVTATTEVHKLEPQKAWIVFGIIFGLFLLLNLNSQRVTRNSEKQIKEYNRQMENMTPEEAGKAMGEFIKGLNQDGARE